MIGQTISHYKILEKLGEGGMGVVYKAQDLKLDRLVALKFLPPRFSASDQDKARFIQEAKAAAALNHPNICTIHGIEEYDDQLFIVMEYVDGVTLRRKLIPVGAIHESPLPVNDAITYALQIGDALQEAHSKGVTHRDIKLENIMVNTKNQIKVMDFGLAKIKGALKLTKTSSTVGTIAYMSPEQIQGVEADARSDLFSFGIVLYEMLTGRLPFRGEHEAALMYSIVNEEPQSVLKFRPELSPEFVHFFARALEKDPQDRFQSAADMVSELRRIQKQSARVSRAQLATTPSTPEQISSVEAPRTRRTLLFSLLGFVIIAAVVASYFLFFAKPPQGLDSVAVMPLVNVGGDPNADYLSDGITEAVINNLSHLRNLRVMSRSSVFRYKGKEIDPSEIGKVFNVRAVLTGRIVRRENDFQLSVELVDSKDGKQLWGEQYSRPFSTVQALQGEISKDISEQLRVQVSGEERANLSKTPTNNPEAYQLYLRGRFNWNKRTADALQRAVELYNQAIEKDPTYAQAYTGLAETYVVMPFFVFPPPIEAIDKGKSYALKALQINPQQAEAYNALARAKLNECDLVSGEQDFLHAIGLNPNYPTAHQWYGDFLLLTRRTEEALEQLKMAQELDPLSLAIQTNLGTALDFAGHATEAIREFQRALEVDPNFGMAWYGLGQVLNKIGMFDSASVTLEKARVSLGKSALPYLASIYAMTGKKEKAREILNELEELASKGYKLDAAIALVYIGFGDKEKTLFWLQRTYNNRAAITIYMGSIKNHPGLKLMWSDVRIQQALKKIGIEMEVKN